MSDKFMAFTMALPGKVDPEEIRKNGLEVEFIGTTEDLDRDNDRVLGPLDYAAYLKNPTVLWMHKRDIPVGVTKKIWRDDDGRTHFLIKFPPASVSEFANEVARMVGWDGLSAVSIGFIPKAREANKDGGRDFYSPELTEISIVTIPSNRNAVSSEKLKSDGADLQRIKNYFDLECESIEMGEDVTKEHVESIEKKLEEIEQVNKSIASIMSDLHATQALVLEKLSAIESVEKQDSEPEQEEEEEQAEEPAEKEPNACDGEEEKEKAAVVQRLEKLVADFAEVKQNLKGEK